MLLHTVLLCDVYHHIFLGCVVMSSKARFQAGASLLLVLCRLAKAGLGPDERMVQQRGRS